jgi:methionyl-tRNA formyltransferase
MPTRIAFFGTAEIACPSLALLSRDPRCRIILVVTQPDRPKGRDLRLHASPVKEEALRRGLPLLQPERARDSAFLDALQGLAPDLIAVVAYGLILPQAILDLPRYGCLNVHASLLPRYRGAAPIQWAILNGEKETGVTIMKMDAGLDTGDILSQRATPILPTDNAESIHHRLAEMGAELLRATIPDYVAGNLPGRKQVESESNYAPKITKEHGRIRWSEPALTTWNRLRAFTPWPGAYTFLPKSPKPGLLKVWQAEVAPISGGQPGEVLRASPGELVVACGREALRILNLQCEGGRRMTAKEFLAGHPLKPGDRLQETADSGC